MLMSLHTSAQSAHVLFARPRVPRSSSLSVLAFRDPSQGDVAGLLFFVTRSGFLTEPLADTLTVHIRRMANGEWRTAFFRLCRQHRLVRVQPRIIRANRRHKI